MGGTKCIRAAALALAVGLLACTRVERRAPVGPPSDAAPAEAAAAPAHGGMRISGDTSYAMHTHGGAPAHVSNARFVLENLDDVPHTIGVDGVAFLSDHGMTPCDGPAATFRKRLAPLGLRIVDPDAGYELSTTVVVPSKATRKVQVGFEPTDASYTSCDTFAFRVDFLVDAERVSAVATLLVSRESPAPTR